MIRLKSLLKLNPIYQNMVKLLAWYRKLDILLHQRSF